MKNKANKPPNQVVGNAGLYYVCYELSRRGWNVLPTSRNARGVDVVIYDQSASKKYTIQIKALSQRAPVPFGTHLNNLIADFIIIVVKINSDKPEVYITRPRNIKSKIHKGVKNGKTSYWLWYKHYEPYLNKWNLIGTGF